MGERQSWQRVVRRGYVPPKKRQTEYLEGLGFLPTLFVERYLYLCEQALGPGVSGSGRMRQEGKGKGEALGKNYIESGRGIKDERALYYRMDIDRRLRAMGRDIKTWCEANDKGKENKEKAVRKRCDVCSRGLEKSWQFCPWCGYDLDDLYDEGGRAVGGPLG